MDVLDRLLADARARRDQPAPALCRLLRERAGLTQQDVAAVLGVSRPAVTRWESGARTPRRDVAVAYMRLLDRLTNDEHPAANGVSGTTQASSGGPLEATG